MINSNCSLFFKKSSGDLLGTVGTFFSVSGPTLTKKLLREFAIPFESSMIFPLTFR